MASPMLNDGAIPMLARVRFKRQVGEIPAGELGTIVHVYPGGEAYEVEFNGRCVETCEPSDIEPLATPTPPC